MSIQSSLEEKRASGTFLARNTLINYVGQFLPVLAAIIVVPRLIEGLGTDRYGTLALAWMVVGYFGLFDLGLGRALTQLVADKLGRGQEDEIPVLIWTTLATIFVMGIVGMVTLILVSPWLVETVLKIPDVLVPETTDTFYILAVAIPIIITSSGLQGVLAAYQRFDLINMVRVPNSIISYVGPLVMLSFSKDLFMIVSVLVASRVLAWCANLFFTFRVVPDLRYGFGFHVAMLRRLMSFGVWMTLSNIISPLLVTMDRFLIAALISVGAVAYYTTPYDMITRLWLIPSGMLMVLFPAFSSTFVEHRDRTSVILGRSLKYIFLAMFPLCLIVIVLAPELLGFWLNDEFVLNSTFVLRWLVIGVFFNSLARVNYALIQGAGRPQTTAKAQLVQVPFYLAALYWAIRHYGIDGAVIVWVARIVVDTILMFGLARMVMGMGFNIAPKKVVLMVALGMLLGVAMWPMHLDMKLLFLSGSAVLYLTTTWLFLFDIDERALIQQHLGSIGTLIRSWQNA